MRLLLQMFVSILLLHTAFAAELSLRISEFAAGGKQGIKDEDGDTPDWIEIENVSSGNVDLSGWSITDRPNPKSRWNFPRTNLASGQFLVVFASGKDRRVTGRPLHTDFKIAVEGGVLELRSPEGSSSGIDNYPRQVAGVSFGLEGKSSLSAGTRTTFYYLLNPTPGRTNSEAVWRGPRITEVSHSPLSPGPNDIIIVTAKVSAAVAKVTTVKLHTRVMFGPEVELPMYDDGEHSDGSANDLVFGAKLAPGVAKRGEMLRYYITAENDAGEVARWPLFAQRDEYSAYEGMVIEGAAIRSQLPVIHLFAEREISGRDVASNGSISFGEEFYDNVSISPHGQLSRMFPKPSFNFEFPVDHRFRYRTNQARVSEIKILGNFADKSKIRNTLAYDFIAASGSIGHFAFPVRLQKNGEFFCVAEMVEDGDERWLKRVELDTQGALYKMYDSLKSLSQAEKKTRKHEGAEDLVAFADAIAERRPLRDRARFAYDNVDLPQCVSYFVAMTLIGSGDHGHKNYYLYRDVRGGEWALLPWDVDLSWGRNWMKTYFDDTIYSDNPLNCYRAGRSDRTRNPLYNLIFEWPEFRQMYLRRLRTVMDEILQAPETPPSERIIERRIRELVEMIDPAGQGDRSETDAALDYGRWPGWGEERTAREEAERIINEYLPGRREFLFRSKKATLYGDPIPESQRNDVSLKITHVGRSGRPEEQYVSLSNASPVAVDISGWMLKGAGIEHQFRSGTVVPAGRAIFVVANVSAFRKRKESPRGGESLLVQGNWKGGPLGEGPLELKPAAKPRELFRTW